MTSQERHPSYGLSVPNMTATAEQSAAIREKAHQLAALESDRGYLDFLRHVVVDAQPDKRPFRLIGERWQWERAERVAPALDHLAGITEGYTGPQSFFNCYHKGSDKTHEVAREVCFLLGWSKKAVNICICAGDKDQAGLDTVAMTGILRDNPWIADRVRVSQYAAHGASGSTLTVLPMDAWTGSGIFPDFLIAEEWTHWKYAEGKDFWNFILATINKRPHCVLNVCTNAGHIGSWQWSERNRISRSAFWNFYEAPAGKPLSSWMNLAKIADDSQGMDPGERDRLYGNRWIDPGEERGYLTLAEAEACVDLRLGQAVRGERGLEYFVSVDYGGVHDRCALGVMHAVPGTDRAVVDRLDAWQGSHANRVLINHDSAQPDLRSVEAWLDLTILNFGNVCLVLDPYQMEGLAQKYERKGFRVERFEYMAGKKNYEMAQLLRGVVQNRKLSWPAHAGLLPGAEDDTFAKELSRLVKKVTSYGYRFDHEAGRFDDRAACVGMGLIHCLPMVRPAGPLTPQNAPVPAQQVFPRYSDRDWTQGWQIMGMGANNDGWQNR